MSIMHRWTTSFPWYRYLYHAKRVARYRFRERESSAQISSSGRAWVPTAPMARR